MKSIGKNQLSKISNKNFINSLNKVLKFNFSSDTISSKFHNIYIKELNRLKDQK
jgi:hypothetical protein